MTTQGHASPDTKTDIAALDYIGSVELRPERGELSAGWTILIHDASLDKIRFSLSSSFGTAAVKGPDILQMTSQLAPDELRRIYHITLRPSETDVPRMVRFAYGGPLQLPPINRLDARKVELTVDGGWYPYEPDMMGRLTAQVGVQILGDWTALVTETVEALGSGYRIRQTKPAFDIAMSWLRDPVITKMDRYTIYDQRTEPGTKIPELKASLKDCRATFETMIGPLPDAAVMVTDRAYEAYSRGTLISLMDIENETDESLFKIVCHELSHHWSTASPGGPDDWINEGLAEYMALMAVRDRFGETAYQAYLTEFETALLGEDVPPIWTEQSVERTPYLASYRAAPLALAELEILMGQAEFLAFLQSIFSDGVGTTPALLDRLEQMAGSEIRKAFQEQLTI
ncbi:MAG: hypothetical protein AAFP97_09155 [Pseudomonadota bacterium]